MRRYWVRWTGVILVLSGLFVAVWGQVSIFQKVAEEADNPVVEEMARRNVEVAMSPLLIAAQSIGIVLIVASFLIRSRPRRSALPPNPGDNGKR